MKKKSVAGRFFFTAAALALLWTGYCDEAKAQAKSPESQLSLEETVFAVKTWQTNGSHLTAVKGRLTYEGQPVANAIVQAALNGRQIRTAEDGSFKLLVDRSLLTRTAVRVVSVQQASISGQEIGEIETARLLSASVAISVYHPIQILRTEISDTDSGMIKVHARIGSKDGDAISFFQIDKYRIAGRVEDADGNPVKNAIVWIDRDRGEGFAKSTPTDRDGRYEMFYWPEEEDTNLTVIVGSRRYALPDGKVFILPRNTSVDIRVRLPREGTTIDDRSPNLVCTTSKGAKYTGLLAGLDVPPEVPYSVTVPDRSGQFVLTVPREVWKRRPVFFETRLTKFVEREKGLKAGDPLPVGFVLPSDQDPRVIPSSAS